MTDTRQQLQGNQEETQLAELGTYVASLVNAVDKGTAHEVGPYDLIPLEFNLLRACMEKGECTATQLAEILPVDTSRISRVVTRLVNMRRSLRLTEKGNELTLQLHRRMQIYDAKLMEGISKEEIRAFASTAFKIIANYTALKQSQ